MVESSHKLVTYAFRCYQQKSNFVNMFDAGKTTLCFKKSSHFCFSQQVNQMLTDFSNI